MLCLSLLCLGRNRYLRHYAEDNDVLLQRFTDEGTARLLTDHRAAAIICFRLMRALLCLDVLGRHGVALRPAL